jgi:hypothetical protein
MKRRTFDGMVTLVGVILSIFLFAAASLLNWGYSFTNSQVKTQLSAQQITFPAVTGNPKADAATVAFFAANGNKIMTTGKEAQMYADHYLGFHLSSMPTYAEASAASRTAAGAAAAAPTDAALQASSAKAAATLETVFKGTTLRGTLLTAYAFWQMGQIAKIGAMVSLVGGLFLLLLSLLGWAHLRRTSHDVHVGDIILPRTLQGAGK